MINNKQINYAYGLKAIIVTWDCNWNCNYCIVDTHDRPNNISKLRLSQKLRNIGEYEDISVAGGEPGEADKGLLIYTLEYLKAKKCYIRLLTNGLFAEKYPDLLHYFDLIIYHCSDKYNNTPITHEYFEKYTKEDCEIDYLLVIENDKYIDYVNKYPELIFSIVRAYNIQGEFYFKSPIIELDNITDKTYIEDKYTPSQIRKIQEKATF